MDAFWKKWMGLLAGLSLLACSSGSSAPSSSNVDADLLEICRAQIWNSLQSCVAETATVTAQCFEQQGQPCPPAQFQGLSNQLSNEVTQACADPAVIQALGLGQRGEISTVLAEHCEAHIGSVAARSFGGPTGMTLAENAGLRTCLSTAFDQASAYLSLRLADIEKCRGTACRSLPAVQNDADYQRAVQRVQSSCPVSQPETQIGRDAAHLIQWAGEQADCLADLARSGQQIQGLSCGAISKNLAAVTVRDSSSTGRIFNNLDQLPRDQALHISLDSEAWGSRCGDGSDYSVLMRLSSASDGLDKWLIHQEGGGSCFQANGDCLARPASLFSAQDNHAGYLNAGFLAQRADNPFSDWSVLFLPYCSQDLNLGGGVSEAGGPPAHGGQIYRYGAINVRAGKRLMRDLLWRIKQGQGDVYRPSQVRVVHSGTSAGGYGVQYGLHFALDEMHWEQTLSVVHAAFAIADGVPNLGQLFNNIGDRWNIWPYLPPYCQDAACAETRVNHPRHAQRLGRTEMQFLLNTSAQQDSVQFNSQGYGYQAMGLRPADWISRMRREFCSMRNNSYLGFFLAANALDAHVVQDNSQIYEHDSALNQDLLVFGQGMVNWLAQVAEHPTQWVNRVDEGPTLDGVTDFDCTLNDVRQLADSDHDGVNNQQDICANSTGTVALNGCPIFAGDADADGVANSAGQATWHADRCPGSNASQPANEFGCTFEQLR